MFGLGTTELLIVGFIVFVLFGAKRLPEIGKGLGGAIREFRNVKKEIGIEKKEEGDSRPGEKPVDQAKGPALEDALAKKVMERVPGVKQAMEVKDKVDKVKKIMS